MLLVTSCGEEKRASVGLTESLFLGKKARVRCILLVTSSVTRLVVCVCLGAAWADLLGDEGGGGRVRVIGLGLRVMLGLWGYGYVGSGL